MTRLARRNKTKRIKAWKKAGNRYSHGQWWKRYTWKLQIAADASGLVEMQELQP